MTGFGATCSPFYFSFDFSFDFDRAFGAVYFLAATRLKSGLAGRFCAAKAAPFYFFGHFLVDFSAVLVAVYFLGDFKILDF